MSCSSIPLFHGEHHSITARKDVDMTFASQTRGTNFSSIEYCNHKHKTDNTRLTIRTSISFHWTPTCKIGDKSKTIANGWNLKLTRMEEAVFFGDQVVCLTQPFGAMKKEF